MTKIEYFELKVQVGQHSFCSVSLSYKNIFFWKTGKNEKIKRKLKSSCLEE